MKSLDHYNHDLLSAGHCADASWAMYLLMHTVTYEVKQFYYLYLTDEEKPRPLKVK